MNRVRALRQRSRTVVVPMVRGTLVPAVRRLLARAGRWWRTRSRTQARAAMLLIAAVGLTGGAGTGALVAGGLADGNDTAATAGVGPALPGATRMGPLAVVLPEDLGPWSQVSEQRLSAVRDAAAGQGVPLDGVWGRIAPDDVVVTVLAAPAGTHGGVGSVSGPFEDAPLDLSWRGGLHRAGVSDEEGVVEAVLVVEAPDGHLVVLSLSGPSDALTREVAEEALRTVRLPG